MAVVVALATVACSPMARYQTLSLVFDGVPPPPGVEQEFVPSFDRRGHVQSANFEAIRERGAANVLSRMPAIVFASVHKPYQENKCSQCHDMETGGVQHVAKDASLCDKCHLEQRQREGWDHGPINLGTCIPCHVPHNSAYEHLLIKPVDQLCLDCHTTLDPRAADYHDVPNFNDCVACHDPHRMY